MIIFLGNRRKEIDNMITLNTQPYFYKDGTPVDDFEHTKFMTNDVFEFMRRSAEVFADLYIWIYHYTPEDFHTDRTDLVYIQYNGNERIKMRSCDLEEYLKRYGRQPLCLDILNLYASLKPETFTFWKPEEDSH